MYTTSQSLSIDKNMVGFKGRLAFLQYMPKKPHKLGDEGLGPGRRSKRLCVELEIIHWQGERLTSLGLGHRMVFDVLDDDCLKNKGYHVYMDNFYTSPALRI